MDKKNFKIQNNYKNKDNQIKKENRITRVYTSIIKANKKNNNNILNEYNKSTSRAQKERKIYNNQNKLFPIEKEKQNSFSKTYMKTEENENDNSQIQLKLINTVSNIETPKNNKIINVKVRETGIYGLNKNLNNIYLNRNLRHSTSLSNNKMNDRIKIILFPNKHQNDIKRKNNKDDISNNKLFNSCMNFSKMKKEKSLSNQNSTKNKQNLIINFNDNNKSEINSYNIKKNQILKRKEKLFKNNSSFLSKKNIKYKSQSKNNISNNKNNINNLIIHKSQNILFPKKEKNTSLKKEKKVINKVNSPNIHHYNYTTLSSRIKSSISTLSSTNSSSSLNKHYKCPIVSFSAIKQKFFSTTTSLNNNNNNNSNYLLTDFSSNKNNDPKQKKNNINNNNYSIITLIINSNWGNLYKVGITEIQLFDSKKKRIQISECHVLNGDEDNISRIFNNKFHTSNEKDMWISNFNINSVKKIKIEMYILNNKYYSIDKINDIIIWNYNGKDLNIGIKEIEIVKKNEKIWKGIIPKGDKNIKNDYSYKINLNEKEINMSDTLQNLPYHKRNFYLSLLKQKNLKTKLNFSQSDLNESKSNISNNNINTKNEKNYYINFRKIKIQLLSNYGNYCNIGLTGLNLIDKNDKIINIENAISIGALPKDLRTIYNNEEDNRVFENIFSNINNTTDENFMWLSVINPKPFIEIVFKNEMTLNRINFWNFNEPFSLDKGVKNLEIIIDDHKKYNIILWKGLGIDYYDIYQKIYFYDLDFKKNNKFTIDYNIKDYPIGFVFKIIFIDNYGDKDLISLKDIFFFDNNNVNLNNEVKFNVISFSNEDNIIYSYQFLDYKKNENSVCNNLLFVCFEQLVQVKYIKIINKKEKLPQNSKNIQIYCDDILFFEGMINQCDESIISFENDYNKLDKTINKDNIINLNSINSKKQNMYIEKEINDGFMLILDKKS